mgnify:CR=1 FL=1
MDRRLARYGLNIFSGGKNHAWVNMLGGRLKRSVATLLVAGMSLSACVTTSGSTANLTPAEKRMRAQAEDFQNTVVQGVVVGAGIGLLAALLSGNKKNAAGYAAAGAVVGGSAGYYVAKQKETYANEEARLDSMIADVRQDNSNLADMSADAKQVIAADMARIDRVEAQLAAGQISQDQARQELARAEDNGKYLTSAINGLHKRHEQYQEASTILADQKDVTLQSVKAYNSEVSQLQTQIKALESERDALVGRIQSSSVG